MVVRSPVSFVDFCERIGVTLTVAQRALTLVAYDGATPGELEDPTERAIALQLYGAAATISQRARRTIVHLCGARGGKSYVLVALRLLHLALTVSLDSLAPGELASALIVAPDLRLARQTFRYALGAAEGNPKLTARLSQVTKESFIISRAGGRSVVIECLPATRGGSAVRARNFVAAGLDEVCFFRDESSAVNDKEIFSAIAPRIMPGGQMILASTPWARMGLMYGLHSENFGLPKTCLASTAPTLILNPEKADQVALERERDPVNAAREYDCVWQESGGLNFFSPDVVDGAVHALAGKPDVFVRRSDGTWPDMALGTEVMVGADCGFRSDSSTLVVVYRTPEGVYWVAEILELQPSAGNPLQPSKVVAAFAAVCKRHGVSWIVADGHYRETLTEELAKHQLSYVYAPEGPHQKSAAHVQTKMHLNSGTLRLPKHPRLLEQMKALIAKPTPGGAVSLISPRTPQGGHGDILAALVLAVSQSSGQRVAPPRAETPLSPAEMIRRETDRMWAEYERKTVEAREESESALYWEGTESWDGRHMH